MTRYKQRKGACLTRARMRHMNSKVFIAGIVLVSVAVTAASVSAEERGHGHGHGPGKHQRMSFSELDADSSGEVTKDEIAAKMNGRFMEADANGDGVLDRDEMIASAQAMAAKRADHMLERFDKDGDAAISLDEMPAMPDGAFDKADADNSGGLSEEEFAQMRPHGKKRKHKN